MGTYTTTVNVNVQKKGKMNPQELWMERVMKASELATDPKIKNALLKITEYDNCPKKAKKFFNFVKNSLYLPDAVVKDVWAVLEQVKAEAAKVREEKEAGNYRDS